MSSGNAGFRGRDIGTGFRFISDCQSSAKRFQVGGECSIVWNGNGKGGLS